MTAAVRTRHWELIRATGAAIVTAPPHNRALCAALDLPEQNGVDHTAAFVLGLPPHAAIYLGPEGRLGGEGLDRVGGFWRALGMTAPHDADHLGVLLLLYAQLGEAADSTLDERVCSRLTTAQAALFDEHLWSWAPAYLAALEQLGIPSLAAWAQLASEVLAHERERIPPPARLPLALREAPSPPCADDVEDLLNALVTPVRSGLIISQRDLQQAARTIGVGFRRGERRFAIKAMLQQEPVGTLTWLGELASAWARQHAARGDDPTGRWWAARANALAATLREPSPAR